METLIAGRAADPQRPLSLSAVADLEDVRGEWSELAERSADIFQTPEWGITWWRHFGPGKTLLASACRDEHGRLVALLPLYREATRRGRVIRFVGAGAGDRVAPVCAPEDRRRAAAALRCVLAERGGWDLFLGDSMPADEGWSEMLTGVVLRRQESPVISHDGGGFDAWLAARSSNFRSQVGRKHRRLEREHSLAFRLSTDRDGLERDLDTLFALHRARWGVDGSSAFAAAEGFHRDFARRALERGWLRLWLMELDGRPVAAWYGWRIGAIEVHYQSGRDPALDDLSVGFVLYAHTVRAALDDGVAEYRTLRGGESYKLRFTDRDPGLETVALPHGALGRAYVAAFNAGRRLPEPGQRLARALRRRAAAA